MSTLVAMAFTGAGAQADTAQRDRTTRRDSAVAGDTSAHHLTLDGTRLHPGRWLYLLTLTTDTVTRPLGTLEHVLAEGTHGGVPSWVFSAEGARAGETVAESLWVTRDSMRTQRWMSVNGPSRLSAEFARDTMYAVVSAPTGRKSIVTYTRPDVLVNEPMTDAVLGLLPIVTGYRDSVEVLVVDLGGCASAPARLTTEGEERLTVPAGTFDALVVTLEAERGATRFWIDKDTRVVLRSEQTLPELGGAVLRRDLVRVN